MLSYDNDATDSRAARGRIRLPAGCQVAPREVSGRLCLIGGKGRPPTSKGPASHIQAVELVKIGTQNKLQSMQSKRHLGSNFLSPGWRSWRSKIQQVVALICPGRDGK